MGPAADLLKHALQNRLAQRQLEATHLLVDTMRAVGHMGAVVWAPVPGAGNDFKTDAGGMDDGDNA